MCAFTVEQGKFLRPIEPLAEYLKERGVAWTYYRDKPSLRLHQRPARTRLRPVQPLPPPRRLRGRARAGRQRDRLRPHRRRFLRVVSAQRPVHRPAERAAAGHLVAATSEFRLIRPLVFVTEDLTRAFAAVAGRSADPLRLLAEDRHRAAALCATCSPAWNRTTRTSRRTMLAAMGNLELGRLLDPRYLDTDDGPKRE